MVPPQPERGCRIIVSNMTENDIVNFSGLNMAAHCVPGARAAEVHGGKQWPVFPMGSATRSLWSFVYAHINIHIYVYKYRMVLGVGVLMVNL